jgi:squalene-hopene/tetraprenyl-beta-curcumene cyclase
VRDLQDAIERAQAHLLGQQAPDGHWVGQLEANTTITSEQLLLGHLIDQVNRDHQTRAVLYLKSQQLPDGGYNLFEAGPANLSSTIKAYFAMKMAGVALSDPTMVAARSLIREMGGPANADVFTKILLALFGEYDWNGVPTMPVEIMLLPRPFFLFNIYEISYWSRTVLVPLLVLLDRKPVKWLPPHLSLDELWPVPREETSLRFSRVPEPFSWRGLFWKSFFIAVDDGLKIWERFSPRPLRRRAIETARLWLEERLAVPGGLGGIYPAMANSILAMRLLGYPDDHPLVLGQLKEIEALAVENGDMLHYQPCPSPVWDTALAVNALVESDLPPDHPTLRRASDWMIARQIFVPGDWQVKRPHVQPGGWAFQVRQRLLPGPRRHRDGRDGPRKGARTRRRPGADRQRARARLVPRNAGRRRRLGLVRRRQQSALPEPHPVRGPRCPARSVHRGPDRARDWSSSAPWATGRTSSRPSARSISCATLSDTTARGTAGGA